MLDLDSLKLKEGSSPGRWTAALPRLIFRGAKVKVTLNEFEPFGPNKWLRKSSPPEVDVNSECGGAIDDLQRAAFSHFVRRPKSYERRLTQYLAGVSRANVENVAHAHDPVALRAFVKKYGLEAQRGVTAQARWIGMTLFDQGWDGHGVVTFDFYCGWDEEHGICLLMHKGQVVAKSGLSTFTCRGDSLLGHAKIVQKYSTFDVPVPPKKRWQTARM